MKVILEGVVGSTAYGLATPESDIDTAGVYVAESEQLLSLYDQPQGSVVTTEPDITYHEVGKFMSLCAKCNPTVTELLWLDEYTVLTEEGKALVNNRSLFLSDKAVRNAYIGYATQQAVKLKKRESDGLEGYGPKVKKRSPKHQRHLMRLCLQCEQLLTTGELTLKVADPQRIFDFGGASSETAIAWFEAMKVKLDTIESVLPEKADLDGIDELLLLIRRQNFRYMFNLNSGRKSRYYR